MKKKQNTDEKWRYQFLENVLFFFEIIVIRIVRRWIEDIAASSIFRERHYNEHR